MIVRKSTPFCRFGPDKAFYVISTGHGEWGNLAEKCPGKQKNNRIIIKGGCQ